MNKNYLYKKVLKGHRNEDLQDMLLQDGIEHLNLYYLKNSMMNWLIYDHLVLFFYYYYFYTN